MRIVGITGRARSGKDTVGRWFASKGAYRDSFAYPIKKAISDMFGFPMEVWEDERKEQPLPGWNRSPRYLAQTLGTEWGRDTVCTDCWILALERRLRDSRLWYLPGAVVVVTDVRLENEASWIRNNGGTVLHVSRPGADGNVGIAGHRSEGGIEPAACDVAVANDGSIDSLHAKLDKLDKLFP